MRVFLIAAVILSGCATTSGIAQCERGTVAERHVCAEAEVSAVRNAMAKVLVNRGVNCREVEHDICDIAREVDRKTAEIAETLNAAWVAGTLSHEGTDRALESLMRARDVVKALEQAK